MPHLSPMSWITAIIMIYFTLSLFISSSWWHTAPTFPTLKISSTALFMPLKWA